jgi:threonyl-tRNA synthetase
VEDIAKIHLKSSNFLATFNRGRTGVEMKNKMLTRIYGTAFPTKKNLMHIYRCLKRQRTGSPQTRRELIYFILRPGGKGLLFSHHVAMLREY